MQWVQLDLFFLNSMNIEIFEDPQVSSYSDKEHKKVTEECVALRLFGSWLHFFIELAVQIITQSNYPGA